MININIYKKLLSNFFSMSILQLFNFIIPIIIFPYLIKIIGIKYYGLLSFANATIFYFNVLVDYGFNLTATREISINRDNKEKLIEIFSSVMIIKFILISFSFFLLYLLIIFFNKFSQHKLIYFLMFGNVIGQALFPQWLFLGIEKMKYITYINIFSKFIYLISIFIFITKSSDYWKVPLLTSISLIISGIISIYFIRKKFGIHLKIQKIHTIKMYFKNSWNIFIVNFLPNLYNNFSIFFLGFFVSLTELGFFSFAKKIVDIFNSILYVIRDVSYPFLIKNTNKINTISKFIIYIGLVLSIIIIVISLFVLPVLFDEKIMYSLKYLLILSISPLLLAISFAYGTNNLLIYKQDKVMRNITIVFSLIGFFLSLILIPILHSLGAAITIILSRIIMAYLTYKKAINIAK